MRKEPALIRVYDDPEPATPIPAPPVVSGGYVPSFKRQSCAFIDAVNPGDFYPAVFDTVDSYYDGDDPFDHSLETGGIIAPVDGLYVIDVKASLSPYAGGLERTIRVWGRDQIIHAFDYIHTFTYTEVVDAGTEFFAQIMGDVYIQGSITLSVTLLYPFDVVNG